MNNLAHPRLPRELSGRAEPLLASVGRDRPRPSRYRRSRFGRVRVRRSRPVNWKQFRRDIGSGQESRRSCGGASTFYVGQGMLEAVAEALVDRAQALRRSRTGPRWSDAEALVDRTTGAPCVAHEALSGRTRRPRQSNTRRWRLGRGACPRSRRARAGRAPRPVRAARLSQASRTTPGNLLG